MNRASKFLTKLCSIFTSGLMCTLLLPSGSYANAENSESQRFEDLNQFRYVGYEDSTEEESDSKLSYSSVGNSTYPSKYDMRELGLVTGTDQQGRYGTCWAFSSIESALSGILAKDPFADFSEWHLSYFTYTGDKSFEFYDETNPDSTPFTKGGSSSFAVNTLSKWIGFVDESVAPYDSSTTLDESLRYQSEYHLTDAYSFRSSFSTGGYSGYTQNQVKQMLLDGNSVMVNMYYYKSSDYYDPENNAYYIKLDSSITAVNHGVTIVGWDDDFDGFENLKSQPSSKGAWLVKNSWDYSYGDYGYFWLSYETYPLMDATTYIVDSNENYAENNYYDDYGWTTSINSLNESNRFNSNSSRLDYASNVFTADCDSDLCAVSFYTTDYNTEYTVYIYTNLTDPTNPTSGTLTSRTSGTQSYMGYHTVNLDSVVSLTEGENYSVVIKLKNSSYNYTVAVESAILLMDVASGDVDIYSYNVSQERLLENATSGVSYVSNDGKSWKDTYGTIGVMSSRDSNFTYTSIKNFDPSTLSDGNYAISVLGNVCIKAFTNPHDKVYYSQYGGNLYTGETIELSNPNADTTIYYTLDGTTPTTDSLVYTEPITFTGDNLTVSARVLCNGVLGDIYTETFQQAEAVVSTLCVKATDSEGETTYTELEVSNGDTPTTELYYTCSKDVETINIYPISTGNITIGDSNVTSGHESDSIEVSNGKVIPITVTKDGCTTMNYTLTINYEGYPLLGDLTADNIVNYLDLLTMKKHILGIQAIPEESITLGDYNSDNVIDILDVLYIKAFIINK